MTKRTPFYACVDVIVFDASTEQILLIKRKNEPFKGCLALPGGYVDSTETVEAAAERELYEETSIMIINKPLTFFDHYSYPERDPRGRVIAFVYDLICDGKPGVKAGDDAAHVGWYEFEKIPKLWFAFDHHSIISDFMSQIAYA